MYLYSHLNKIQERRVEQHIPGTEKSRPPISSQFRVRPAWWCMQEKPRRLFARQFEVACIEFARGEYSRACRFLYKDWSPRGAWSANSEHKTRRLERRKAEQIVQQQAILCSPVWFEAFLRASFQIWVYIRVLWWFLAERRLLGGFRGGAKSSVVASKVLVRLLIAVCEEILCFLRCFNIFAMFLVCL